MFDVHNQCFIDVSEVTANVHYILSVAKDEFGQNYSLVTNDGWKFVTVVALKVTDSIFYTMVGFMYFAIRLKILESPKQEGLCGTDRGYYKRIRPLW